MPTNRVCRNPKIPRGLSGFSLVDKAQVSKTTCLHVGRRRDRCDNLTLRLIDTYCLNCPKNQRLKLGHAAAQISKLTVNHDDQMQKQRYLKF
jgi:ethanolamine utilization protein EutA (predicted chaperonin)